MQAFRDIMLCNIYCFSCAKLALLGLADFSTPGPAIGRSQQVQNGRHVSKLPSSRRAACEVPFSQEPYPMVILMRKAHFSALPSDICTYDHAHSIQENFSSVRSPDTRYKSPSPRVPQIANRKSQIRNHGNC